MKVKLYFNNGETAVKELNTSLEDAIINQMQRPQEKRLYTNGIEFKQVKHAEIF